VLRPVVVVAFLAFACSPPVSSADCTTGAPCSSGQVCNPTTRRCELSVGPGVTGGGTASSGGGSAGGGSAVGGGGNAMGGGTAGGSMGVDGGVVSAWTLTLDVSALNRPLPATCYVAQMVPSPIPQGPSTLTVDAVLFDDAQLPAIALDPQAPFIRLGDSPSIELPDVIDNGRRDAGTLEFIGERQTASLGPTSLGRNAIETRISQVALAIDRRTSATLSGTLRLSSSYRCSDNGTATADQCPRTAPFATDAADCSLTMPFQAQPRASLPAWIRPRLPTAGAEQWALLLDARFIDNSNCYVSNRLPQARVATANLRVLYPMERFASPMALAIEDLSFSLGDAPRVTVDGPLTLNVNQYRFEKTTTTMGPLERNRTALETRSGSVTLPFTPAAGRVESTMTVTAQYLCVNGGAAPMQQCPSGTSTDPLARDAANCTAMFTAGAFRLP
jgi:hypothetical protein